MHRSFKAILILLVVAALGCQRGQGSSKKAGPSGRLKAPASEMFAEGAMPPDFKLQAIDGRTVGLSDLKGKVVLLNFWATWCAPCVLEMPALERVHLLFKDKGLQVVAISADTADKSDVVREFLEKNGITFTVLRDPEMQTVEKYGLSGFPETFFLDRDSKFMAFDDPDQGRTVRLISDRAWDSPAFTAHIEKLLARTPG